MQPPPSARVFSDKSRQESSVPGEKDSSIRKMTDADDVPRQTPREVPEVREARHRSAKYVCSRPIHRGLSSLACCCPVAALMPANRDRPTRLDGASPMILFLPSVNLRRPAWVLGAGSLALLTLSPVLAATATGQEIDWLRLFMGLFGGLALFPFGMDQMANALPSTLCSCSTRPASRSRERQMPCARFTGVFAAQRRPRSQRPCAPSRKTISRPHRTCWR